MSFEINELSLDDQENEFKFPFKFGISKELDKDSNNFFNASIHCLANIKKLTIHLFKSSNESKDKYIYFISDLLKDVKEENNINIKELIKNLKRYIINEKKYPYETNKDPRQLIDFLLEDLHKKNELPKEILAIINKKCNSCGYISESNNFLNIVKFDIPEIIRYKKNIKQNNIITINTINIFDCFDYYLKSVNYNKSIYCDKCQNKEIDLSIKELPSILIIFVYYGLDKNCCYENSYEFAEEINFKKYELENNNRDYFLSSIIACKNLGTYFELFYTFSRDNESSKYILFNGMEIRNNLGLKNKLIKNKINLKDKKQTWPFVLIYTDKNIKI